MPGKGGPLHFSLLSRGIGEVQNNGHEKVEVMLEPADYYNFKKERPYSFPPIHTTSYPVPEASLRLSASRTLRDASSEISLPKTFTTRKGALLLFSEEMALKTSEQDQSKRTGNSRLETLRSTLSPGGSLDVEEAAVVLKTVDDLAKSILQYGSGKDYEEDHNKMHLKFIHHRREQWDRQIRPGFSAKRYLSTWTRTWNEQVLDTVVSKGYMRERPMFQYSLVLPQLRRHLFHDDLSSTPQPYRLMRAMLLAPGSLAGFTFFRDSQFVVTEEEEEEEDSLKTKRPDTKRSIRVIRTTEDGEQVEVSYWALDRITQREVIIDLLVKSAVYYALTTQEVMLEQSMAHAMPSTTASPVSSDPARLHKKPAPKSLPMFDMKDAVNSLLDSQRGLPFILGGDLPDADNRSLASDVTGSLKGSYGSHCGVRTITARQTPGGTWTGSADEARKEYSADASGVAGRDFSASSSSVSSVPQLPPISARQPLSPIKDVSRETSQIVPLPPVHGDEDSSMPTVNVMPATPQQSAMTGRSGLRSQGYRDLRRVSETDPTVSEVSSYNVSSDSSMTEHSSMLAQRPGYRGRTKGFRSPQGVNTLAVEGPEQRPGRGSMIMAPDGEIIHVGGTVPSRPLDVSSDATEESGLSDDESDDWRTMGRRRRKRKKSRSVSSRKPDSLKKSADKKEASRSSVTEQDILDTLTEHAKEVADRVFSGDQAGQDLEEDIRSAADMWMDSHPGRAVSRGQTVQDTLKTGALEDILAMYRASSADPTMAEYRDQILQALITAVVKAAGLDPQQVPADLELSPELLEALASQALTPQDIAISRDEETGRFVIRGRQEGNTILDRASQMDGVQEDLASQVEDDKAGSKRSSVADIKDHIQDQRKASLAALEQKAVRPTVESSGAIDKENLSQLYNAQGPSSLLQNDARAEGKTKAKKESKKKGKKGKKGKKDEDGAKESDRGGSASSSDRAVQSSSEPTKSDDDVEVTAGKDELTRDKEVHRRASIPHPQLDDFEDEDFDEEDISDDEDDELQSQANREARAARRAAAAAKRKEEVEKRRKEREAQSKRGKAELERQEQLKREMEEERLRREEERRLRKLQEEEDEEREEREREEEERQRQLEEERERREKEEHQRKLDEMRRQQMDEEERRRELDLQKEREEEERRAQEELMLSQMAEQERLEYERRKREEEAERKRIEEEEKQNREEEARQAMAEARRLAEEMARKQAALEAKLQFNRSLRAEARNLRQSHNVNRAFVFSYFQLVQWLGLDMPQFELSKMTQY